MAEPRLEYESKSDSYTDDNEISIVPQVEITVPKTDDPTSPTVTFRMWFLGITACVLLSFLNQFFWYRTNPLTISPVSAQIVVVPIGHLMGKILPTRRFFQGTRWSFTMNPGPFSTKEHVLITVFANSGSGLVYASHILSAVMLYYKRRLDFFPAFLVMITTQVLGFGWAGLYRKHLVEPCEMWWPSNLVQVSLFSPKSIFINQLGSGSSGLSIGAFGLDWSTIASYLGSPLASPFFATTYIAVGFFLVMYVITPLCYYQDFFNAKTYPIHSGKLFVANRHEYNITSIINDEFRLDHQAYAETGPVHMSTFFVVTYGLGFATLTASIVHVLLLNDKDLWTQSKGAFRKGKKMDVHTRIMKRNYKEVPLWWFLSIFTVNLVVIVFMCVYYKTQIQLPWWGAFLACLIAIFFTPLVGVIMATTNQVVGTLVAVFVYAITAWWLIAEIPNMCDTSLLPLGSQWTCPTDRVFFDASVVWGLVGPRRMFGDLGEYSNINWFFLGGAIATTLVYLATRTFPNKKWISDIHIPVLIGATTIMPPASAVNFTSWLVMAFVFGHFVFKYRREWWQRYNYVLSGGMDAGTGFMFVLLFLALQRSDIMLDWWGNSGEGCSVAKCPTTKGVVVHGCPVS
ncbi:unnamed protein product [Cochlearia groenlandica]